MRFLPSMPAAIVTGLVITPILILGCDYIEQRTHSQLLLFLWGVVAFFIPVTLSTVDREFMARRRREKGFLATFIRPGSAEAFRECYIPTWLRMGAWFASAVVSAMLLKLFRAIG
jgi:hypothetical protein